MNRYTRALTATMLALGLAIGLAYWTTGCGTNAPTKAAQAEQILIRSVNDGMTEWAAYVNAGKAKSSQIQQVKNAYNIYYTTQLAIKAVIEKLIAKDPGTSVQDLATANAAVVDAENALIATLNAFLQK